MRLRTEKTSFWVPITIGGAACEVELNPLSSRDLRELIQKHSKTRFSRGQKIEETDEAALRQERFDQMVLDWEGITDLNDEPLPCTAETKRQIAEFNHDFVLAVFEAAEDINVTLNAESAATAKK